MNLWTEIVNTALIGCERKQLSLDPPANELGALLARLDPNDREGALLGASAIVSLYNRAAALPMKDTHPLPGACEPDDTPHCSEQAVNYLVMMLQGMNQELLPEWLAKVADAGWRAPEELLPELLELGRMKVSMWEEISQTLCARGRWLAAQNPAWTYAVGGVDERLWETVDRDRRPGIIRALRKRDAARARALLASDWARESLENRIGLLGSLKDGLNLDDEAFLEAALDDRNINVRNRAADLLAGLPGSALSRRMFERVHPLIAFKIDDLKRNTIEVSLPEKFDKTMHRDGVRRDGEPTDYVKLDKKAWWLQQMLGFIPPKIWLQESGWTISELIEAAKHSQWGSVLLNGWFWAAANCHDVEWADIVLNEFYERLGGRYLGRMELLFQILPQAQQEAFIIKVMKAYPGLHRFYIERCYGQWSEALSRAVIDLIHIATKNTHAWGWYYISATIGCRLDPALIPEAISRLTEATKPPTERLPAMERFLDFIQFRHEMLNEF